MKRSLIIPCYNSVVLPYSLSIKKDLPNQCLLNQDISELTSVTKFTFFLTALEFLGRNDRQNSRIEPSKRVPHGV